MDRLLGEWRIPHDTEAGRQQFGAGMEERRRVATENEFDPVRQGWCLGSEAFRQDLLAQVDELASPHPAGPEIRESGLAKAERLRGEE